MSDPKDPRTVREVNFVVQGIKEALGGQITLLQLGVGACLTVIIAVAGGGFALYHEIGNVDRKVSVLQTSMDDLKARVERMNTVVGGAATGIVGILNEQTRVEQALTRIEMAVSQKSKSQTIALTPDEITSIRAFFKLTKKTNLPPRFKLGDKVPAADLKPMPEVVYQKIAPQLKGTNFLIDQSGALIITAGAENTVALIVEPA